MRYSLGCKLRPQGLLGIQNDVLVDGSLACVAGEQRGGRGEVECEREARSLGARRERAPNDRASRSHSTFPLSPLCTPATQANGSHAMLFILHHVVAYSRARGNDENNLKNKSRDKNTQMPKTVMFPTTTRSFGDQHTGTQSHLGSSHQSLSEGRTFDLPNVRKWNIYSVPYFCIQQVKGRWKVIRLIPVITVPINFKMPFCACLTIQTHAFGWSIWLLSCNLSFFFHCRHTFHIRVFQQVKWNYNKSCRRGYDLVLSLVDVQLLNITMLEDVSEQELLALLKIAGLANLKTSRCQLLV